MSTWVRAFHKISARRAPVLTRRQRIETDVVTG
jgi:hypothetical protein